MFLTYLLSTKKIKAFYIIIVITIFSVNICNNYLFYRNLPLQKLYHQAIRSDMQYVNNYISKNLEEESPNILLISSDLYSSSRTECSLDYSYFLLQDKDILIDNTGEINWESTKLSIAHDYAQKNADFLKEQTFDYLLSYRELNFTDYNLVDLKNNSLYFYESKNETAKLILNYNVNGIYPDNWIGQSAAINTYSSKKEVTIQIEIDSPLFDLIKINCEDGIGILPSITANSVTQTYEITIRQSPDGTFVLNLYPEKTMQPPNSQDTRELSFRILSVKKI